MTLHFLNESPMTLNRHRKSIITSFSLVLRVNQLGNLINSRLLISGLPGMALRTNVESLSRPRDVNKRSEILAW